MLSDGGWSIFTLHPLHPFPKNRLLATFAPVVWFVAASGFARGQTLSDLLTPDKNLAVPAQRAEIVARLRAAEALEHDHALQLAAARGFPRRVTRPDGSVMELMKFDGNRPVYFTTHNVNAAISTGANLLQAAPYSLTGAGVTVGVWDGGAVRSTHQEFGVRVTVKDGAALLDHSTHVAGTVAAAGVVSVAKGMAPSVNVDSYEWTNDKSEMTARGATYPGESGKIYLSNQSYGYVAGWNYTGLASPMWDWWGNGTTNTATEQDFGKYDTNARDSDTLAVNAPYFLMFRSAGNDRFDNPSAGQSVTLSPNGTTTVTYNPALHPPGDGVYKNGYDTLGFDATAKDVITIGSVSDAVTSGQRDLSVAALSGFSSCGPTDDGRIKPDVVANGENLYSTLSSSDSAYGYFSGTSMATPNATGSAVLLVSYFDSFFPAQAARASTLKALLIHTADDLGNPGPDYQYGWGLLNVKAAADLISAYHAHPGNAAIAESRLTSSILTRTHTFTWDGVSPIRATLVWTDPAGTATTTNDNRTARLVNNLDLKIVSPGGASFLPYVMPYVGDWTAAKLSATATTGKNNTDNVEQVYLAAPTEPGVYQAVVTVSGTLTNGVQNYSLLISGGANVAASAPALTSISPASGNSGTVVLNLTGSNFLLGATVRLTKTGQPDLIAGGIEALGDTIKCRADLTNRAAGTWNVVVTNPDGQAATLPNAFTVIGSIWQDDLESGAAGWTHGISQGSVDSWALSTAQSHSATHAFSAAGPSSTNINDLSSPSIAIPSAATNLNVSFWHNYNFQNGRDGGVLEFAIDGGSWFDVTDATSGAAFASGGYNSTFTTTGNPSSRNPLAPRACWTGANTGFTQVVVNLTDTAKYAGHNLKIRWRLATNNSTASTGWTLDDIALNGGSAVVNLAPTVTVAAAATPSPVNGASAALSVTASDDAGEAALTYNWSYIGGSFQTPVSFSDNGTNSAKATAATFSAAGTYTFTVTVRDADGLTADSSVDVVVNQTTTSITISPGTVTLGKGDTQAFGAVALDQFGTALAAQPAFTWSADGGGSVDASGVFSAAAVGGPFTITATSGTLSGGATVTVTGETLTHWRTAHFSAAEINAGLANDLADADGDGLPNFLEYAFGLDPRTPNALPAAALDLNGHLSLTLTRPKALPGLLYSGEASSSLESWPTSVSAELILDGDPQTIRFTDPLGSAEQWERFLRVRVTRP